METPRDVIEERQRALADPGEPPLSQTDLAKRTERFKGGPIARSTISRWASGRYASANVEQLEIFAYATADALVSGEAMLSRLLKAFGHAVDDSGPWEPPAEVDQLDAAQKQWLTDTVRMLARTNRRLLLEQNGETDGGDDVSGRPATGQQ